MVEGRKKDACVVCAQRHVVSPVSVRVVPSAVRHLLEVSRRVFFQRRAVAAEGERDALWPLAASERTRFVGGGSGLFVCSYSYVNVFEPFR